MGAPGASGSEVSEPIKAAPSEAMISQIFRMLERDASAVMIARNDDEQRIVDLRSAGRKAGRRLGWKVLTRIVDDGQPFETSVLVVAVDVSSEVARRFRSEAADGLGVRRET